MLSVENDRSRLILADCLDALREMPDCSIDSIVTDPPYGLSFMGKRWDYDVPSVEIWAECLRVLKPGGHLLAFAGTRTQHRMAVRIEDAGFEIRDMIAWVYGSGFPKSMDLSKALDKSDRVATDSARQWKGWGTALKPALEPITVARKPLIGTVAANVLAHGTGALNIDGCRVDATGDAQLAEKYASVQNAGRRENNVYGSDSRDRAGAAPHQAGRFPANLIHDGSEEVLAGFPQSSAKNGVTQGEGKGGIWSESTGKRAGPTHGDTGSAARFFKECKQWQDRSLIQSSAGTVEQSSSLSNHLAATVQNAVAIWPSLAGILSSEQPAASTPVTLNESKAISETAMQAMSSIASGFSQESQHERLTPCGSLVRTAAIQRPTGTTTITTSLCRSDGSAGVATFTITPSNLDRGEAVFRFNYCAKASKKDREEGLGHLPAVHRPNGNKWTDQDYRVAAGERSAGRESGPRKNSHPTVKPTELMRYLCRLVTPPGGTVLDPFMGSGSTGKAALLEGFVFIGIEREQESFDTAVARIASAVSQAESKPEPQSDLFSDRAA